MMRVAGLILLLTVSSPAAPFFHKGVNFTAEGREYAGERSLQVLAELRRYNVNTVALVPFAFERLGDPQVRFGGQGMWERDEAVEKVAAEAHRLGLRVMLKPHVWVRPGFPGDLDFTSEADRATWFASYGAFLDHMARLAVKIKADYFCVGNEFGKLTRYVQEWRKLIQRARSIYRGPLLYAAVQGPEFENLNFWDALDYIGLNNYYPIPDDMSMNGIVRKVEAVHRKFKKPVIFPEAGFASLEAPHRAPWDETRRAISLTDQARCYEALLKAFYDKPWFHGVYWWKVGSTGYGGPADPSHTPWGKPAMDVVGQWFRKR